MDKIDTNILNYYLQNVRGFLHGQKRIQAFPGIEKNIENILVEIAVHHTYPCENLDDVSKTILEDIKSELIKNQNNFELICTFQELECGTRSLIYTKNKVKTMKEVSQMRQPVSMTGPLPMQPLRQPNTITSKPDTTSSLITSSFKLRCLNATLKFVKDDSTLTLRYPDMASEQADFIVNMFQQSNVDSNIGLGYKTMYAPLWEAMKIFGLKYKFTLRHGEAKSKDMKCLILDKLPIISKSDKTNQDQQTNTPASITVTFSTDNVNKTSNDIRNDKFNDTNGIKNGLECYRNCNSNMSSNENLNTVDKKTPKILDILVNLDPTYITDLLRKIFKFLTDETSASLIIENLAIQEVQLIKNFKNVCSKRKYLPHLDENAKILSRKITEKLNEKCFRIEIKIDRIRISENGKIRKCKRLKDTLMQNVTLWKVPVTSAKRANIMSSPTSLNSSNSSSYTTSSNSSTSKQSLNSLSSMNSQFSSVLNLNDNEKSMKTLGTNANPAAAQSKINTKQATTNNSKNVANPNNIIIIPTVTSSNSSTNVASNNNKNSKPLYDVTNSNDNTNTKPNTKDTSRVANNNNVNVKPSNSNTTSGVSTNQVIIKRESPNSNKNVASLNNINTKSTRAPYDTSVASSNNINIKQETISSNTKVNINLVTSNKSVAIDNNTNTKPITNTSNSSTSVASNDNVNTKQTITSSNSVTSVASHNNLNIKPGIFSSNSTISVANSSRLNKTKQKLLEGLNQPVVADKAAKIMLNMGWSGGGLGAREEGITTPLAPGMDYYLENKPRLGLGGLEVIEKIRAENQQNQQQKSKRSQSRKQLSKTQYHINSLETILRLLINDESYQEIELPQNVYEREWGFVKHLILSFNSGCRQTLSDERQIELVNFIGCIMASGTWRLNAEGYFDSSTIIIRKKQIGPRLNHLRIDGDSISIYSFDGRYMQRITFNNNNSFDNPNNIRITINNNTVSSNIKTEGDTISVYSNDGRSMKRINVNNKKQTPVLKPIMLKSEGVDKTDFQNFTNLNNLIKEDQISKDITFEPNTSNNEFSMNNQRDGVKKSSEKFASVPFNFKSNYLAHILLFCKQDVELKTVKFSYNLNENEKKYVSEAIIMINKGEKCMESPLEERFYEKIHEAMNGYTLDGVFTSNHSINLTKKFNSKTVKLSEDDKENQNNNNNCKAVNNNNIARENSSQVTNNVQVANSSKAAISQVVNNYEQEVKCISVNGIKYNSIEDLEASLLIRSVKDINNDIDKLIDKAHMASCRSSQVVDNCCQVANNSGQVVNNSDLFTNDNNNEIDDISVVIASDEEEYLLLSDDDFTKNGLAKEFQELRDLYNEEKTIEVEKNVNNKAEPKSTEDIPKMIEIKNNKQDFIEEPCPGKRSRPESETPKQKSKKSKNYAKQIAIVPKNYPEETITQQTARDIQIIIKDSIDNYDCCSNLELPLLKCNGLENGVLLYCCFTEKSFYFIEDLLRNSDFKIIYGMSKEFPGIRMTLRINSFFVEKTELTLNRLAKYNKGLSTKKWKVIKRLFSKDCDLFLIEIDEDSYNYIREANFSLFAGIDKVLFNHYGE